jgi:hypothetical protein
MWSNYGRASMTRLGVAIIALFVVYFPAAAWVKQRYVDIIPKGKIVVQLIKPFEVYKYANVSHHPALDRLSNWADPETAKLQHSPIVIYEDTVPLGPGHNTFDAISKQGAGRYSHWRGGVVFSASDNSDPNSNNRTYWAVLPNDPTDQSQ